MNRGKYIVLEGPEGVGKTTQLAELARRLQAAGLPVRTLREPDSQSDLTARAIRQLTQDPRYPMNTRTEVLLYNAARAQSLQVIKQSVEHGVICLVDRNYLTTLAIQYYGRGDIPDYQTINSIISFAVGGIEPDLCMLLDAPVATLKDRLKGRYNGERFDNLDDSFLERVRAGYLWEAHQRQLPVVFATEDTTTIADHIWKLVSTELAVRETPAAVATGTNPTSVKEIIDQKTLPDNPAKPPTSAPPILPVTSETNTDTPRYHTPDDLTDEVRQQYDQGMSLILAAHDNMLQKLIKHLSDTPEADAQTQAENTLRAVLPLSTTEKIDLPADSEQIKQLAQKHLPDNHAAAGDTTVELVDFWPKNELLLVPDMLYPHSNLSLDRLQSEVSGWPYDRKAEVFKAYNSGPALEKAHYSWDFLTDYGSFFDLREQIQSPDNLTWQTPTPRYGYKVPKLVEDAGLTDQYEECFDNSLKLHSYLHQSGYLEAAQQATLIGHKLRWQVTYNAAQLLKTITTQHPHPATATLTAKLQTKLSEVHPLTAETIISI